MALVTDKVFKRFGHPSVSTTVGDDTPRCLGLNQAEINNFVDARRGFASDNLLQAVEPRRPQAMQVKTLTTLEQLSGLQWYSTEALYAVLLKRGQIGAHQRNQVEDFVSLTYCRPLGLADTVFRKLFTNPHSINSSDIATLNKTLEATEAWLQLMNDNPVSKIIFASPVSAEELALELRSLGAPQDYQLFGVLNSAQIVGVRSLIPGANIYDGIQESRDMLHDAIIVDGKVQCSGLRAFSASLQLCVQINDRCIANLFGEKVHRGFVRYVNPFFDGLSRAFTLEDELVGQLMFLRDGLLRLINRDLESFLQGIADIRPRSSIGNIIESCVSSSIDKHDKQEQFLMDRKEIFTLLSTEPKLVETMEKVLLVAPLEHRAEIFDLIMFTPGGLEALHNMYLTGKGSKVLLPSVSWLGIPIELGEDRRNIANRINSATQSGRRNVAILLFDNAEWLIRVGRHHPQLIAEVLAGLELHEKPYKLFSEIKPLLDAAEISSVHSVLTREFGESVAPVVVTKPLPSEVVSTQPSVNTADTPLYSSLPLWCRWYAQAHELQHGALDRFSRHVELHGRNHSFKKFLLDPANHESYAIALGEESDELSQALLTKHLKTSVEDPKKEDIDIAYDKILICGGSGGTERERIFTEKLPATSSVEFFYSESGSKSFQNISKGALGPRTLVVWITDQTSHAECWRVWDMALAQGASFQLMRKGLQNPGRIIEELGRRIGHPS